MLRALRSNLLLLLKKKVVYRTKLLAWWLGARDQLVSAIIVLLQHMTSELFIEDKGSSQVLAWNSILAEEVCDSSALPRLRVPPPLEVPASIGYLHCHWSLTIPEVELLLPC